MANEIRVTVGLRAKKNNFNFNQSRTAAFNNVNVDGGNPGTVTLTTSEADIDFGSVTPAWVMVVNLSTGSWFRLGPKDTTMKAMMKFPPGGMALFPMSTGTTLRAVTVSTGTVDALIQGLTGPATT